MATLTRRQLYDLIWSKPMRDAAQELGLSDVGLKKVCTRHRVPVPPQGYWNKVRAGQKPHKILFRDVEDLRLNRIEIAGSRYEPPPEVRQATAEAQAREQAPENKVIVAIAPPTLPAAIQLASALKKTKSDEKGLASVAGPKLLHVCVAPANIDRAVAIAEALLRAAADRGFAATPGAEHLTLVVDGEPAILSLKEGTKRVAHVRTQEELEREERRAIAAQRQNWDLYSRLYKQEPRWDYKHLGLLTLEIDNAGYLGVRKRWSDTQHRKLEALLNDVLAGLVAFAAARKVDRAAQEKREREWKLQKQRAEEARAKAALEKARVEFLAPRLDAFDEMMRLQRFLSRLEGATHWAELPPCFGEFRQWAERRVESLRRHCSAEALQEALADSPLFGPEPKPPGYYPRWD
jgi:hypothetical protein